MCCVSLPGFGKDCQHICRLLAGNVSHNYRLKLDSSATILADRPVVQRCDCVSSLKCSACCNGGDESNYSTDEATYLSPFHF